MAIVSRAGRRPLREPGLAPRRRRRVVGVVLSRGRRDRRRSGARHRRRPPFDPGRRRVRRRARRGWARRSTAATTGSRRARAPALDGIAIDCTAIPDAAMTLAVVALFARGPTTLTGIASWRVKETDRIAAMATELRKLGATVDAGDDRLTVHPPPKLAAGDHRHLRRPSDGDVLFARGAGRRAGAHPRSRLRAQDVSRLLRRRSRRIAKGAA